MANTFKTRYRSLESPAANAYLIVPDDGNDVTFYTRAIYVGGDGNIAVTTVAGDDVVFVGAKQGSTIPVSIKKLKVTGTSASNIIGLY